MKFKGANVVITGGASGIGRIIGRMALEKGAARLHFIRFQEAILPSWLFDFVFGTIFGIYHTMDHFTGRKK